jgi:hypothetical protein
VRVALRRVAGVGCGAPQTARVATAAAGHGRCVDTRARITHTQTHTHTPFSCAALASQRALSRLHFCASLTRACAVCHRAVSVVSAETRCDEAPPLATA